MIVKPNLLMIKYQGLLFEPSIDASTPKLDMSWTENHSYNILNKFDEGQKIHLVENISVTLEFYNKIY